MKHNKYAIDIDYSQTSLKLTCRDFVRFFCVLFLIWISYLSGKRIMFWGKDKDLISVIKFL